MVLQVSGRKGLEKITGDRLFIYQKDTGTEIENRSFRVEYARDLLVIPQKLSIKKQQDEPVDNRRPNECRHKFGCIILKGKICFKIFPANVWESLVGIRENQLKLQQLFSAYLLPTNDHSKNTDNGNGQNDDQSYLPCLHNRTPRTKPLLSLARHRRFSSRSRYSYMEKKLDKKFRLSTHFLPACVTPKNFNAHSHVQPKKAITTFF